MDGAKSRFAGAPSVVFQRRVITRDAMPGAEDHDTLSVERFKEERAQGAFALSWQAHGLWYGVPIEIETEMRAGRSVIVNTSRTVIETAQAKYSGAQAIVITAAPETLAKRLAARGRETQEEIAARLSRSVTAPLFGKGIWQIENDGSLDNAVKRFVEIVEQIS